MQQYTVRQAYNAALLAIGVLNTQTQQLENLFEQVILPAATAYIVNKELGAFIQDATRSPTVSNKPAFKYAYQEPTNAAYIYAYTNIVDPTVTNTSGSQQAYEIQQLRRALSRNGVLYTNLPVVTLLYIKNLVMEDVISVLFYNYLVSLATNIICVQRMLVGQQQLYSAMEDNTLSVLDNKENTNYTASYNLNTSNRLIIYVN